ncbi:MAG: type I-U CRISPR-associated protein Csb2 [Geminicoccaceae bacterium]|nr:type I-U CRISPR-associated protein Csb2 [Geminicoccaceae bacterium]MCS7269297.1 type I-U CRISPR-associated protein Csb2 [Geminicoccaceae bacterium]MCX7631392.1 type I-U CRISPR-associated protein Csb2 [Geminicoccaceae bacterium]MDW8125972.1 type I-U CRISPR-associated protein Csb2 [Geminicoccaceae bacterium]
MALLLEVEFLAGFCAAATGPDNETPEWPIEGDRLFSALVASWGAHGCPEEEKRALCWLEGQPAPRVRASAASARSSERFYVPPNDARLDRGKKAADVFPALRKRQERRFAVARPEEPIVLYSWSREPEPELFAALDRLARDTVYLGASRSLVRCRFRLGAEEAGQTVARWVYPGRLDELVRRYRASSGAGDSGDLRGRRRSEREQRRHESLRPLPGVPVLDRGPSRVCADPPASVFSDRWLVLEHLDGEMPALLACALVARTIRDALLSGYRREGSGDRIPEVVSGHAPDGSPAREPHLAIVPLAFAGFPYADGRVLGYALVPPRASALLADETFRRVLRRLAPVDEERGHRVLTIATPSGTEAGAAFRVVFVPRLERGSRRSLDPELYTRPARRFASVTPVVLDRHLKKEGAERRAEIAELLASACERIGLPRPIAVESDRHSAIEGAPSVRIAGTPPWMRWRLPDELASRQLVHAVVEFREEVRGPVLLGAGRFCGLGLMRALP